MSFYKVKVGGTVNNQKVRAIGEKLSGAFNQMKNGSSDYTRGSYMFNAEATSQEVREVLERKYSTVYGGPTEFTVQ